MRYNPILKPCKLLQQHHGLSLGEGVLNKVLYREVLPRGPTPYPMKYHKIPKTSPGAYIFQRPFLRGLFLEGPVFGRAYVRRDICIIKSVGLACSGKAIYHFCFVLLCTRGQILSTSPPGGSYSEGRFNGGFFVLPFWGAYICRGLFSEFYSTVLTKKVPLSSIPSPDKIWYPFHILV